MTVADARFAKPIDAGLMAQLAAEHDLLVTVEEGVLAGGFGSAVWETLNETGTTPRILRVGLPDRYVTHGKPALLHEEVGFTGKRIAERRGGDLRRKQGRAVGTTRVPTSWVGDRRGVGSVDWAAVGAAPGRAGDRAGGRQPGRIK